MDYTGEIIPRDVARYREFLKRGSPGPHAYTVLLGREDFDLARVLKSIEKGLPWTAFERLTKNLALPADRVAEMIAIPRRTLARRKIEKRFTREESDRLLRVARVFSRALQLYDGDREAAVTWLTARVPALGTTPVTLLQTEIGAQEVERVIGALEHGIFL